MAARKPADFGPPDWLPLQAAFARIRENWGSRDLAAGELYGALLDGRLKSAAVLVPRTGQQERHFPEPEFWRGFELVAALDGASVRCRPREGTAMTGTGYFFVRRSDLDALYPTNKPAQAETTPPGRRRGPKPKYDWPAIDREIVQRCINKKTRVVRVPENELKLVKDMLDWCQIKYDESPSLSAMREAVRRVVALLRPD
jgi:hypothetical protein